MANYDILEHAREGRGCSGSPGSAPVSPGNSDPPSVGTLGPGPSPECPALPSGPAPGPGPAAAASARPRKPPGRARATLCTAHGRLTAPPAPSAPRSRAGEAVAPLPHLDSRPMAAALPLHGGGHSAPAPREPGGERRPFRAAPRSSAPRRAEGAAQPGHPNGSGNRATAWPHTTPRKRVTNRLLIENKHRQ